MLEQYITNEEHRQRCIEAIGRVMQKQDTGHLILVEGKGASGKTLFAQALTDVLRERGKRVNNIVDENKDAVDVKEGVVVIYQIYPYTSIAFSNDEGLKRRTTTILLDACFHGKQCEPDVKQALMEDFRRIVVVDGDNENIAEVSE